MYATSDAEKYVGSSDREMRAYGKSSPFFISSQTGWIPFFARGLPKICSLSLCDKTAAVTVTPPIVLVCERWRKGTLSIEVGLYVLQAGSHTINNISSKNTARNLIYFVVGFALVANMIHIGNFMIGLLSHKFLGETHTHTTLLAKRAEEMSLLRNNNPILGITLKDHASLVLQIIPFSIMLYYTSLNNKITKLFALIVTTSSIVCILLSQHRTAYVGLLVGILYLALFVEKRLRKYLVAGFVISIVIVSIGTVYFGRFSDPQMYESVNTFSGGRVYVWGRVIQFLVDNPLVFLIGGGKACFINEGSSYLTLIGYPLDPHSAYLGELISKGIIGLLIFIYFLYYTLKSQIMFMKSNSDTFFHMVSVSIVFNLIAACVVHIFGGIGFPGTDHVHAYIWLFLGVTSMASRNRNNNDSCSRISQAELKN